MKHRAFILLIPLTLIALSSLQGQGMKESINLLEAGIEAYQAGEKESALASFQQAHQAFSSLLQTILSAEDQAYTTYYDAMALYFIARIEGSSSGYDEAEKMFQQAISSLRSAEIIGEEYIRSKYMIGLCSFRKAGLTGVERSRISFLDEAVGDFEDLLADELMQIRREDFLDIYEQGTFFLAYSYYLLGSLQLLSNATLSDARTSLTKALELFPKLEEASSEIMALSSKFMEAVSHYTLARLYMRVHPDEWEKFRLKSGRRISAIEDELNEARSIAEEAIAKSGTYPSIKKLSSLIKGASEIGLGSTGNKNILGDGIDLLMDFRDDKVIGGEATSRIADGQLLQYLIYEGNPAGALGVFKRAGNRYPDAYYWAGWIYFIMEDYDKAIQQFNTFLGKIDRKSTRHKELEADCKFRVAECYFWKGVKEVNIGLLDRAKDIYRALTNPKGVYYSYLSSEQISRANTRLFLVNIEGTLQGNVDVSLFETAMEIAGLKLPDDAESYIETGKYFLEKGIRTAEKERETALLFAKKAFDLVLGTTVTAELKNRANFLKGVDLVKLSTLYEDEEQARVADEARNILRRCKAPYDTEAQYVTGISYFIQNDYERAKAVLSRLKGRGHIRAAYYYALSWRGECIKQGETFLQIQATVKDRTNQWYQWAELELAKLRCRSELTPQTPFGSIMPAPPMTYENLVDKKADEARKKREALYIWQRSNLFASIIDIDKVISEKPPKTNVVVELLIKPSGADEVLRIDDKEMGELIGKSHYRVELTRGTHTVKIGKKGFYLFETPIKVVKSESFEFDLNKYKAVRYTKADEVKAVVAPVDVVRFADGLLTIDADKRSINYLSAEGKLVKSLSFSSVGVSFATALAVSGENIYIVDSRRNRVIKTDIDGSRVVTLLYPDEEYEGRKPVNPTDIALAEEMVYIVDSGNRRLLKFEGEAFRRAIGEDELRNPFGVGVSLEDGRIYVADWGLGKVAIFDSDGELIEMKELEDFSSPVRVRIDDEGYIWVVDMVNARVGKYDSNFRRVAFIDGLVKAPRAVALLGRGPESTLFVAGKEHALTFKGSWDNTYNPLIE